MFLDRSTLLEQLGNAFFFPSEREQLIYDLQHTAIALCDDLFVNGNSPYWFTDHGPRHSDNVCHYALQLAQRAAGPLPRLSSVEAMVLVAACYLHDIGMAHISENCRLDGGWTSEIIDQIRQWHVTAVDQLIPRYHAKLERIYRRWPWVEAILPLVCKAHGTNEHLNAMNSLRTDSPPGFRGELVGRILILADEFDIAAHRAGIAQNPQVPSFPPMAQAHHFKHHYVSAAELEPPQLTIQFAFPEELPARDAQAFTRWVLGKIASQVSTVTDGLPAEYARALHITPIVNPVPSRIPRELCHEDIRCEVRQAAAKIRPNMGLDSDEDALSRPNYVLTKKQPESDAASLHPAIDHLMDTFYRECDDAYSRGVFSDVYIRLPHNVSVEESLVRAMRTYSSGIRTHRVGDYPSTLPFVVVGPSGCGKSAFIRNLRDSGLLATSFSTKAGSRIVAYVDCLNLHRSDAIFQKMLIVLRDECKRNRQTWHLLLRKGWNKRLDTSALAVTSLEEMQAYFRAVVRILAEIPSRSRTLGPVPVYVVLDNLDRVPSESLKQDIGGFAARECKAGLPMFILPFRKATKLKIDRADNDIPALPDHSIEAPNVERMLIERLKVALSDKVLNSRVAWTKRAVLEAELGKHELRIDNLQRALGNAIITLAGDPRDKSTSLIPGLAGHHMRDALTLFRAVMKSIDTRQFLMLSTVGERPEHYLIERLMKERLPYYAESQSKIRNMFTRSLGKSYFSLFYLTQLLWNLQERKSGDHLVPLARWRERAHQLGINGEHFSKCAWSLMTGEFPLVELENIDERLPNARYPRLDNVDDSICVGLGPAGIYMLEWLVFDVAYLKCVLQDTPIQQDLSERIGRELQTGDLCTSLEHVELFIDYLSDAEKYERRLHNINASGIPPLTPQMKYRFEKQRKRMLG